MRTPCRARAAISRYLPTGSLVASDHAPRAEPRDLLAAVPEFPVYLSVVLPEPRCGAAKLGRLAVDAERHAGQPEARHAAVLLRLPVAARGEVRAGEQVRARLGERPGKAPGLGV